ncbi:hypothetical protein BT67DRAFT_435399 [Trichocladium antarcticum]|uniref:Aminoglycoside phosphotransferase domain-containing protein n=1 Tax=Trichocladium antarcticum TaxID=1450529 RepID=A0AAN6UJ73_9PEZI|nr:hypothetical protein BT67DRAFT_435399 [Trichocladium antarcticum]
MPDQPLSPALADGIEPPPTPNSQGQVDAVLGFFRSPRAIASYGHVRARILAQGMGMFVVVATTSKGHDLAIKMGDNIHPSERDMADLAAQATHPALTGRMYELQRVRVHGMGQSWESGLLVGDRVPGETAAAVWARLGRRERRAFSKDMTAELAGHVARMRAETRNFYDGPVGGYLGPFAGPDPEAAFDEWAIGQLPDPAVRDGWRVRLARDRRTRGCARESGFVLTHGDLTWNNIMVVGDGASGRYRITGLIGWDRSAFLPDYAEHAVLSVVSFHDEEWRGVLRDAVPRGGCSGDRLEFTRVLQAACNPRLCGSLPRHLSESKRYFGDERGPVLDVGHDLRGDAAALRLGPQRLDTRDAKVLAVVAEELVVVHAGVDGGQDPYDIATVDVCAGDGDHLLDAAVFDVVPLSGIQQHLVSARYSRHPAGLLSADVDQQAAVAAWPVQMHEPPDRKAAGLLLLLLRVESGPRTRVESLSRRRGVGHARGGLLPNLTPFILDPLPLLEGMLWDHLRGGARVGSRHRNPGPRVGHTSAVVSRTAVVVAVIPPVEHDYNSKQDDDMWPAQE